MIEIERKPNPGPPYWLRWLAFIGWIAVPIGLTWIIVAVTTLWVLWWGLVWMAFSLIYMILYFRWSRRRYPKD